MPIDLSGEVAEKINVAFRDAIPLVIATASAAAVPDLALKGSAFVYDKDHVAYWERVRGQTLRNLQENPAVALYYLNVPQRSMFRLYGVAEVIEAGPVRDEIMSRTPQHELDRDPERKGAAILIRIDRVVGRDISMEREVVSAS
jgi:hypothetical protein